MIEKTLRRKIRFTYMIIFYERLVGTFWPIGCMGLVFLSLYALARASHYYIALNIIGGGGVILLFLYTYKKFSLPKPSDVYARLDLFLIGNPVAALFDDFENRQNSRLSWALWQAHLLRMQKRANQAPYPKIHIRLAQKDPFAVRLITLLVTIYSGLIGWQTSDHVFSKPFVATSTEAWIKQPEYTHRPDYYLNDIPDNQHINVVTGSTLLIRTYDGKDLAANLHAVTSKAPEKQDIEGTDQTQWKARLDTSGLMSIHLSSKNNRQWPISLIPDYPPTIDVTGDLNRTIQGAMQLPFLAQDDFAIMGGDLVIKLNINQMSRHYGLALPPRNINALAIPLIADLEKNQQDIEGIIDDNFAKHLFAGLPVTITLQVYDAMNQKGHYVLADVIMAQKRFFDPLAGAIIDIRRQLMWNDQNAQRALYLLRAITYKPDNFYFQNPSYALLRKAINLLNQNTDLTDLDVSSLADLLWDAAILIEDGDFNNVKDRLRRAQERLSEAMENGANEVEIDQLMQALNDAARAYLDELATKQNEGILSGGLGGGSITQDEIQNFMDEIERLMALGQMDEAMELLQQLQTILDNLRVVKGGGGSGNGNPNALNKLLEEQQNLADETFRELQERFKQEENGHTNDTGDLLLNQSQLAMRQGALGQLLEQQQGGEGQEELDKARQKMQQAEKSLRQGEMGRALNEQSQALDALRGGIGGRFNQDLETDPLGRSIKGNNGPADSGENSQINADNLQQKNMREIFDMLHKRAQDAKRPEIERDYLNDLVTPFAVK